MAGEGRSSSGDGGQRIAEKDRRLFFTAGGRVVRDGGGVEPDVKVLIYYRHKYLDETVLQ